MPRGPGHLRRGARTTPARRTAALAGYGATGQQLGSSCLTTLVDSAEHLRTLLRRYSTHPLWGLVQLVHGARQRAQGRRRWDLVQATVVGQGSPKWVVQLLRECFGMYVLLRGRANPNATLPRMGGTGALYVSKRVGRRLSQLGIRRNTWRAKSKVVAPGPACSRPWPPWMGRGR